MALKILDLLEAFFERFVPAPMRRLYHVAFRYSVFVFGGLIGWVILIGSEQLLLRFGIWRGIGYAVGLVLAIIFTFVYHRYITFGVKSDTGERFLRFAPIQVVIAAANWLLFLAATEYLKIPVSEIVASFFITFILSLVNFAASKLLVFHRVDAGKSL